MSAGLVSQMNKAVTLSFLLVCISSVAAQEGNPQFRHEAERAALGWVCGLSIMEAIQCKAPGRRWCTMEELLKGGLTTDQRRAEKDPSEGNLDYRFSIAVNGDDISISAIPRRPGLGGFLNDRTGVYFNPDGPASRSATKIRGGADCDYLRAKF